jgi:hypothetical protein
VISFPSGGEPAGAPRSSRRAATGFLVLALAGAALAACGSSGPAAPTPAAVSATAPLPIAGSWANKAGVWAAVPMGRLGDPDNTFWQLFLLPAGASSWRLVTPPGVADNGGLVLAPERSGGMVVGFETSELLGFSPLAASDDGGGTWTSGVLPSALAQVPSALAVSPAGTALALSATGGEDVLRSAGGLSSWPVLAGTAEISRGAGSGRCAPASVEAVSFGPSGRPVVGASCTTVGEIGVFEDVGGWRDIGPALTGRLRRATATVVLLSGSPAGLTALVAAHEGATTELLVGFLGGSSKRWRLSPPLSPATGSTIRATGSTPGGGVYVLSAAGRQSQLASIDAGAAGRWRMWPTPPVGTLAAAFPMVGRVDALVVAGSVLTDDRLAAGGRWREAQTIRVPILYGSSS